MKINHFSTFPRAQQNKLNMNQYDEGYFYRKKKPTF